MTQPSALVHDVELRPSGWRFAAPEDRSLLIGAAMAGIRLPAACRNGTCRTCLCRAEGAVTYPSDLRAGLTREERAEGWILPCIAHPAGPLVLDVPKASPRDALVPAAPPVAR